MSPERDATTHFKEAVQRFEKVLIGSARNAKLEIPSPPSLGGALNSISRHPSPFDRNLQETLYKILRYRNQCVHDGIMLPVSLVQEYLVAMEEATMVLDEKGMLPAYFSAGLTPAEGNAVAMNNTNNIIRRDSEGGEDEDDADAESDNTATRQYPPSHVPAGSSAAARPHDGGSENSLTLALTATGSSGNGYSSMDTILAAASLAARGLASATAWALTSTATVISGAIAGGMSTRTVVAGATLGPGAAVATALPGSVSGMASASLGVAASTAASIGMYGARVGNRLWVGAATEVARMVGNSMTKGSGEVVETTVVRLPKSSDSSNRGGGTMTHASTASAAPAATALVRPIHNAFDAL